MIERFFDFRLPPPAIVIVLLLGCVFLLRLPSALVARELNVDESQGLSLAIKFLVDPRPWKAVDGQTVGPLNSYLISVFLLMGFKPGFVLVHMLASALVCLQIFTAYLTLRRLGSAKTAALGAFLMVMLYGLSTHQDYLHYASELLPTLLLMVGFYMFLVWLDESDGRRVGVQLCLLFSSGLALGTAPWCKLQAVPITGSLGVVVLAAIFRDRGSSFSFSLRVKELIAFCAGAVLTTCVMLAVVAKSEAINDFWCSYILNNFAYAGSFSLTKSIANFLLIFLMPPIHQLLLVALAGGLLVYVARSADILLLLKKRKWAFIGLLVYAAAALFAVCRSNFSFPHYAIFLVPPMTYLSVVSFYVSPEIAGPTKRRQAHHRMVFGLILVLLIATIDAVRYANMMGTIRKWSHSQPHWDTRIPKAVADAPETSSYNRMGTVKHIVAGFVAPDYWEVTDSNERIAAVVRDIQKTHPVRSLAIWGWAPGVYVLTGIPPATRDPNVYFVIRKGPLQKYNRNRFMGDLRANLPDLFVDAVAQDAFMWSEWTENDGYESDLGLRTFIADKYLLVDELTLVEGAKPVRFFARRQESKIETSRSKAKM